MTYEIVLVQSGAPESTEAVIATTRRYNGAVNVVKVYGDDAAENMALHTDFYDDEFMDYREVKDDNGNVIDVTYGQFEPDGTLMRFRRVYMRKKVQK